MKLTQPSITFFLLSLASTAQATKINRRGLSDYGGERILKSKSTKAPTSGKGSKSQAPSLAPSSAPTRSVNIDTTTCLVEGTTIEGSATSINGDVDNTLFEAMCNKSTSPFSTQAGGEALADTVDAIEAAGYGTYPILFGASGSDASWQLRPQTGALNGDAYCVDFSATNADKGGIVEYNADIYLEKNAISSFSYDYYVDACGDGGEPCGNQFYLNIYLTQDAGGDYYTCRYDYTNPAANGVPGNWYTVNVDLDAPNTVAKRSSTSYVGDCPATPNDALANGFVWGNTDCENWRLNMGDTGSNDNNMVGCYDNVSVEYDTVGSFTFDFQAQSTA